MASIQKFEGRRSRGIVWVCDIAKSSKYLNSNESAEALETFLQRLLYLALIFVEVTGGEFIKWTGDGFLAWYETPLHRNVGDVAHKVFMAAWDLAFWVNVTQLDVKANVKFKVRHSVTFEHDALIIDLAHSGNRSSADVLGRAVVLACRLCSIQAPFPFIVTQGELVKALPESNKHHFTKLKLTAADITKYFKDERWGVKDVYVSYDPSSCPRKRRTSPRSLLREAKRVLKTAVENGSNDPARTAYVQRLCEEMRTGPAWTQAVISELARFLKEEMFAGLAAIIPFLEEAQNKNQTLTH